MKNTSRNKFLLCFRPVVDMDVMLESRGVLRSSNNRGLICESVQDEVTIAKTSSTKSVSSDDGFSDKSLNFLLHRPPNRKLSRVIRAVVFETILRQRARKRQRQPKYITSNENSDDQKPKLSIGLDTDIAQVKRMIRSPPSSLSSSSSSGSNISSSTIFNAEEIKQNQSKRRANAAVNNKTAEMDCYNIVYLVLAIMIFTVFWGKLGGIVCTSVWLYCHPHRRSSYCSRQTNRSTSSQRQSPETETRRESSRRRETL